LHGAHSVNEEHIPYSSAKKKFRRWNNCSSCL